MSPSPPAAPAAPTERIVAIDALRGFDMFWIVGGGSVVVALVTIFSVLLPAAWVESLETAIDWTALKQQMNHMDWVGFSAEDLIMPLFLFVVGAAMPFSLSRRLEAGKSKWAIYWRVLRRVVVLWVFGMIVQGNLLRCDVWAPQLADPPAKCSLYFFSNTLQAIAVGYLVASIALIHLPKLWQGILAGVLVLGYWAILQFVPVPGGVAGVIEPGNNLGAWVDEKVIGRFGYGENYTWILGCIGFAATTLLGVFAGHLLRSPRRGLLKVLWLTLFGIGGLGLGLLWHGHFRLGDWHVNLPEGPWQCLINKHIWSSSMVLYAAGWSYLLLAGFYLVTDVMRLRRPAFFFTVIGSNAILAYMVWPNLIPFNRVAEYLIGGLVKLYSSYGGTAAIVAKSCLPLLSFALLWLLLLYLYRKGTYLRV